MLRYLASVAKETLLTFATRFCICAGPVPVFCRILQKWPTLRLLISITILVQLSQGQGTYFRYSHFLFIIFLWNRLLGSSVQANMIHPQTGDFIM